MEAVLIVLIVFSAIVAIIVGPFYLRNRPKTQLINAMRIAYERGQPVPTELVESLMNDAPEPAAKLRSQPERDLRRGVVFLAIAAAFVTMGLINAAAEGYFDEDNLIAFGIATLPGFLGLAFIAFGLIGRNKSAI